MECCQTCHKETPRDRDACLHCGAEFSPPAMKGIEIFA
jgi:predicted amidophosphoribosyltransferase